MVSLLEIPNCIGGTFVKSSDKRILSDHFGSERVVISNTSDSDLRRAKRELSSIKDELQNVPLEKLIAVIKKSMDYYYTSREEFQLVSSLTGSPVSFIELSINELKEWVSNIQDYLSICFGDSNFDLIPIKRGRKNLGYLRYVSNGPVVGILPRNSEVEAAYLMIQILLSGSPSIIKTSSSSAGPISSIRFVEALHKALDDINDSELEVVRRAFSVVNIFNTSREELAHKLGVKHATYVIFGSNDTIVEMEKYLADYDYNSIVKMGTGLSISAVFEDADLSSASLEVLNAASLNNGRDCISTNAVYVSEKVYDSFLEQLKQKSESFKSKSLNDPDSVIGLIEQEIIDEVHSYLKNMRKDSHLLHESGKIHLSIIEMDDTVPICEFPAPILMIRKFSSDSDLLKMINDDLSANEMRKNLATSLFTANSDRFSSLSRKIPSFIIKHNKGTEKMNMFLEHQGNYLIRDFLRKITLESDSL